MKHALAATLTALFITAAATQAQARPECRGETARSMDVTELLGNIAPEQAVNFLVSFKKGSDLYNRMMQAQPEEFGAILNEISPVITFDADSARVLNDRSFNEVPIIVVQGCLPEGAKLLDEVQAMMGVNGIEGMAPDVILYETPVIPSPQP